MGHITKEIGWANVDIDTNTGNVFVQERWNYTWQLKAGVAAWTRAEKTAFHKRIDKEIWSAWSYSLKLKVTGTSPTAKKLQKLKIRVNFDIRRVTMDEHWKVFVRKIPAAAFQGSQVMWSQRKIILDTNDFNPRKHCKPPPQQLICNKQIPVAHEFGHAIGNTFEIPGRGDEYRATHANKADKSSIMNVGRELRKRHFRTLLEEMNKMINGCSFSVLGV